MGNECDTLKDIALRFYRQLIGAGVTVSCNRIRNFPCFGKERFDVQSTCSKTKRNLFKMYFGATRTSKGCILIEGRVKWKIVGDLWGCFEIPVCWYYFCLFELFRPRSGLPLREYPLMRV